MTKTVTIKTIAAELRLSTSAVSKALNGYGDIGEETKERVLRKAEELGYSPNLMARSLVKKSSCFIGIVIRDVSSVYGEMFKALNEEARKRGLNIILYDTDRDAARELDSVRNLVDSMAMGIIVAPVCPDVAAIGKLCGKRVPVVYLGNRVTDPRENIVAADGVFGVSLALERLISLGHRDIAFLCDANLSSSRAERIEVYRRKMREIGTDELIFSETAHTGSMIEAGYRQAKRMLDSGKHVTAVFVVKDMLAIGAIQAIRDAGLRVPEDISVIGYDGIDAAALPPIGLTTVAQPREEIAEKIIDLLIRHREDSSLPPEQYYAKPLLIERNSCAENRPSRREAGPARL